AQRPVQTLSFDALTTTLAAPAAPASAGIQELTVTWKADNAPPGTTLQSSAASIPLSDFVVLNRQFTAGEMPRERHPELSTDQLVIIGADVNGTPMSWSLIKDPRIVRAEQPGAGGVLEGRVLYRVTA